MTTANTYNVAIARVNDPKLLLFKENLTQEEALREQDRLNQEQPIQQGLWLAIPCNAEDVEYHAAD